MTLKYQFFLRISSKNFRYNVSGTINKAYNLNLFIQVTLVPHYKLYLLFRKEFIKLIVHCCLLHKDCDSKTQWKKTSFLIGRASHQINGAKLSSN